MASRLTVHSTILIIGGGTWGCSTALHLVRRGYKNVTVLEANSIPSAISAGNDINKIIEQGSYREGEDYASISESLLKIASEAWNKDPIFRPYYHETGYIVSAQNKDAIEALYEREVKYHLDQFKPLDTAEDFHKTMPKGALTGPFTGWKGWYMATGAGWAHSRKALLAAHDEAKRLGAKFVSGDSRGKVVRFIYTDSGSDIRGAETVDGVRHLADRIILTAGANAPQLLDFENQLRPTAWTLAHIPMTETEAEVYKDLPVLFNIEKGFFMEPDEDRRELKICDEHPGYCNFVPPLLESGKPLPDANGHFPQSVPFAKHQIPIPAAERCREFLRDTMPHLSERPFSFARVCWCVDTPDRGFLITYHPKYPSLVLGSGDSGHGYMHITTIGGFIADCMEGVLEARYKKAWRWRSETIKGFWGDQLLGRWGAGNKILDIREAERYGWTNVPPREAVEFE